MASDLGISNLVSSVLPTGSQTSSKPKAQIPNKTINPQCQVVWFQWSIDDLNQLTVPNSITSEASNATAYDLSHLLVENVTFTKTLASAAGAFSFRLAPTKNWVDTILPGQWCLIFMSNDGDLPLPSLSQNAPNLDLPVPPLSAGSTLNLSHLRAICYIERVSAQVSLGEKGEFEIVYEVSGRDYGVIYEETELWYNYFQFEESSVEALAAFLKGGNQPKVTDLLKFVHNLFFAAQKVIPQQALGPGNSLVSLGQQWLLPKPLINMLNLDVGQEATFYGNISTLFNFDPTQASSYITNITEFINGRAWQKLKEFSVAELHELYPELDDTGSPKLNFRPIPWSIDATGYPDVNVVKKFANLPSVYLPNSLDILSFDLGRDNHNRYTHFLTAVQNFSFDLNSNIAILKQASPANRTFPFMDQLNVMRHGFRPMHLQINTLVQKLYGGNVPPAANKTDEKLLVQYNEVIYDYWKNGAQYESGSIQIIGNPLVRLGKILDLDPNVDIIGGKLFYIEGYTDTFTIGGNGENSWIQSLQVTHGLRKQAVLSPQNFAQNNVQPNPKVGDFNANNNNR